MLNRTFHEGMGDGDDDTCKFHIFHDLDEISQLDCCNYDGSIYGKLEVCCSCLPCES